MAGMLTTNHTLTTVLFDLGNTLIYHESDWRLIMPQFSGELVRQLQARGYPVTAADGEHFLERMRLYYDERDTEFWEYTTAYQITELLKEHSLPLLEDNALREVLRSMFAITQRYWHVMDDTHATLQNLRRQGYRMSIISNASDDDDVQTLVDKAGIRPYFEIILTSAAFGYRKPNPRIFRHVLDQMSVQADQAVMVGDTLGADILGASNAGMGSVWIWKYADTAANRDHLDTIQPDAKVETLSELPALLADWYNRTLTP